MSDLRTQVIKLAHQNPELRPVLLPLLREGMGKTAMEFKSKEALEAYLKDHPKANKNNHSVKETGGSKPESKDSSSKPKDSDSSKSGAAGAIQKHLKTLPSHVQDMVSGMPTKYYDKNSRHKVPEVKAAIKAIKKQKLDLAGVHELFNHLSIANHKALGALLDHQHPLDSPEHAEAQKLLNQTQNAFEAIREVNEELQMKSQIGRNFR
jgi:hypothetical protein